MRWREHHYSDNNNNANYYNRNQPYDPSSAPAPGGNERSSGSCGWCSRPWWHHCISCGRHKYAAASSYCWSAMARRRLRSSCERLRSSRPAMVGVPPLLRYAGAAAIVHVNVVRVGGFGLFGHGCSFGMGSKVWIMALNLVGLGEIWLLGSSLLT